MRLRKTVLTEHELEIMQIVWQNPAAIVGDVYEVRESGSQILQGVERRRPTC